MFSLHAQGRKENKICFSVYDNFKQVFLNFLVDVHSFLLIYFYCLRKVYVCFVILVYRHIVNTC